VKRGDDVPKKAATPVGPADDLDGCSAKEMMTPELRADLLLRLRKAAGQVNGVAKMVEADRYCMDVLQQLDAAQKALEQVSKRVMRNYLERCVTDAMSGGDPLIYDELMRVIYRSR
jgi:DNA-binding FrmR family transcriptional regulator